MSAMANKFKTILYVPVHVEIDMARAEWGIGVEKVLRKVKRELAKGKFSVGAGEYSYQFRKCRIKDIVSEESII